MTKKQREAISESVAGVTCRILGVGHFVSASQISDPLELARHAYTCLTGEIVQKPADKVFNVVEHKPGKVLVAKLKPRVTLPCRLWNHSPVPSFNYY